MSQQRNDRAPHHPSSPTPSSDTSVPVGDRSSTLSMMKLSLSTAIPEHCENGAGSCSAADTSSRPAAGSGCTIAEPNSFAAAGTCAHARSSRSSFPRHKDEPAERDDGAAYQCDFPSLDLAAGDSTSGRSAASYGEAGHRRSSTEPPMTAAPPAAPTGTRSAFEFFAMAGAHGRHTPSMSERSNRRTRQRAQMRKRKRAREREARAAGVTLAHQPAVGAGIPKDAPAAAAGSASAATRADELHSV